MSTIVLRDIEKISLIAFNHKQFTKGEVQFFLKKFGADNEVENLLSISHNTKDLNLQFCNNLKTNLPKFKNLLDKVLLNTNSVIECRKNPEQIINLDLQQNKKLRKLKLQNSIEDNKHKIERINLTFEEKQEELTEFYSDLERKLFILK